MTDAITRPLAQLMAAIHNDHRAEGDEWQPAGCAAAIHKARHLAPWDQLAHAAIAYAMRADVKTPGLLHEDGPHWRTGRTPDTRVEPTRCTEHPTEWAASCRSCAVEAYDPTDAPTLALSPEQIALNAAGKARALAALEAARKARTTPTPTDVDGRARAAGMHLDREGGR